MEGGRLAVLGVNSQWPMCKVLLLHWSVRAQRWYHSARLPSQSQEVDAALPLHKPTELQRRHTISIDIAPRAGVCHAQEERGAAERCARSNPIHYSSEEGAVLGAVIPVTLGVLGCRYELEDPRANQVEEKLNN